MFNSLRENLHINQSRSDFELYFTSESTYLFIYLFSVYATEETY